MDSRAGSGVGPVGWRGRRGRPARAVPTGITTGLTTGLTVLMLLLLAGCSVGTEVSPDAGAAGDGLQQSEESAGGSDGLDSGLRVDPARRSAAGRVLPGTAVISTGTVSLLGPDLDALREEVDEIVDRAGGRVSDERSVRDGDGVLESVTLRLRVPAAGFEPVMAALKALPEAAEVSVESEDVTTEVIDVESRITTQEASLTRLRGFLDRAAGVDALVRVEREIARREADLASLRSQQDYLADRTSLSTVAVQLRRVADEADPENDTGFLAGLRQGWEAFVGTLVLAATVLGATLPFLLALVLLAVPAALTLRRRRRSPPVPAASPGAGPAEAAPAGSAEQ